MNQDAFKILQDLFKTAVTAADPMLCLSQHLPSKPPKGRFIIIGAGKASARMAEAVEQHFGRCEGLVITRYDYERPCEGIEIVQASHPVPDDVGVQATQRILDLLNDLGADDFVLTLISGGGSALLCAPENGLSLEDKQKVNQLLLDSGAPITEMNTVRKHLSKVKGGQLAAAAYPARMLSLIISDVAGDDLAFIASGPTVGDNSTRQDALDICKKYDLALPDSVLTVLSQVTATIPMDSVVFEKVENKIIAAPSQSLAAAEELAKKLGFTVKTLGDSIEGEARDVAVEHVKTALKYQSMLNSQDKPFLMLSGGECTVTRRGNGIGGPNAEFTLAAAIALNSSEGIYVLSCDTDGVDGAAEVAGAVISPDTLSRAKNLSIDASDYLERNDSHRFFAALNDQVITGPTLTNVNDFRAILIYPLNHRL